jgi:hypothetical protein
MAAASTTSSASLNWVVKVTKNWCCEYAFISPKVRWRKANASVYENFKADGDLTKVDQLPDDPRRLSISCSRSKKPARWRCWSGYNRYDGIVDALDEIQVTGNPGC